MIEEHPTWHIHDSSKSCTYLDCPRKYFYDYVLGWKSDRPAHDLHFGNAWHVAREHQLIHGYEDTSGAYLKFLHYYRDFFPQETDDLYRPKDPAAVSLALEKFRTEKSNDLIDNELLFTETSGTVPINFSGRVLHYRMDSVLRRNEDGKIFSWDHKSAKKFSRTWADKFHLSIQNGTYTHCLYCMYPIEEVLGIEFCGTAFTYLTKGSKARSAGYHIDLLRVSAWKTAEQMNNWLWLINDIIDNIERDFDRLSHCKDSDNVLMTFPMNPESCTKYWGCQWHDYCLSWENPLRRCQEPPLGFHYEFWNPSDIITTNKINLEWPKG